MSQRRVTTGVVTVAQSWPVSTETSALAGAYVETCPPPLPQTRLDQAGVAALVGSDLGASLAVAGGYVEFQAPFHAVQSSETGSYAEVQTPHPQTVALVGGYGEINAPQPVVATVAVAYVEQSSYACVVASSHKVYIELLAPPPPQSRLSAQGAYVELWGGAPITNLSTYVERLNRYGTVQQAGVTVEIRQAFPLLSTCQGAYLEKTPPDNVSQPHISTATVLVLVAATDAALACAGSAYVEVETGWPDESGNQATGVSAYLEGQAVYAATGQVGFYLEFDQHPIVTASGSYWERLAHYGTVNQVGSYLEANEKLAGIGEIGGYLERLARYGTINALSGYVEGKAAYTAASQTAILWEAQERFLRTGQAGFYAELRGALCLTRAGAYQEALERFLRTSGGAAYWEASERFLRASEGGLYWEGVERTLKLVGAPGYVEFRQRRIRASGAGLYWEGDYVELAVNGAPAYIEGVVHRVDVTVLGHYLELGGSRVITATAAILEFKVTSVQIAGVPVYVEVDAVGPMASELSAYVEGKETVAATGLAGAYVDFRQRRIKVSGAATLVEARERFVHSSHDNALVEIKERFVRATVAGYYWERGGSLLATKTGFYWERRLRRLTSGPTSAYVEIEQHQIRASVYLGYVELAHVHSLSTRVAAYRERRELPGPDVTQFAMMWEHKDRAGFMTGAAYAVEAKERFLRSEQSSFYWEGKERYDAATCCGSYVEVGDFGPSSTSLGVYLDKIDCGNYLPVVGTYLDKQDLGNYLPVVGVYLECSDLGVFMAQTVHEAEQVHTKWIKFTGMGNTDEFRMLGVSLTATARTIEMRHKRVSLTHLGRYIEAANVGAQMTACGFVYEAREQFARATTAHAYMERWRYRPIEVSQTAAGVYVELVKPGIASTQVATYYELKPWERQFTMVGSYAERIREIGTPVGDGYPGLLELHTRCYDMYRLIADWQSWEQGVLGEDDLIGDLEGIGQLAPGATPRYFKGKVFAYRDVSNLDSIKRVATVADLRKLWRFGPRVLYLRANHLLDVPSPYCLKVYWHGDLEIKWLDQGHSLAEVTLELVEIL